MSAADPTGAAGGTAGTAGPGQGSQPGQADEGAGSQGSPGSSDYLGQLRAGGDFAVREATAQQSRADKAEAKLTEQQTWFGQLDAWRTQGVSGDVIAQHLGRWTKISNDPALMKTIEAWESTGRLPGSSDLDDGEDLDEPDEGTRRRDERITANEGEVNRMAGIIAQDQVQKHTLSFFNEFAFGPDDQKAILDKLSAQVQTWTATPTGRQSIQALSGPGGEDTIRALALAAMPSKKIAEAAKAADLRVQEKVRGLATDGPSGLATTGEEPPPEFKGANAALDAFRWAGDQLGIPRE